MNDLAFQQTMLTLLERIARSLEEIKGERQTECISFEDAFEMLKRANVSIGRTKLNQLHKDNLFTDDRVDKAQGSTRRFRVDELKVLIAEGVVGLMRLKGGNAA